MKYLLSILLLSSQLSAGEISPAKGMKWAFKFNEGSGAVTRQEPGGLMATLSNTAWVSGAVGKGIYFSGSPAAYAQGYDTAQGNVKAVSFGFWRKLDYIASGWCCVINKNVAASGNVYDYWVYQSNVSLNPYFIQSNYSGGPAHGGGGFSLPLSATGKWVFIVGTHDYLRQKIYVNGKLYSDTADAYANQSLYLASSNKEIFVGVQRYNGGSVNICKDTFDNVFVIYKTLTSGEVAEMYRTQVGKYAR